MEEKVHGLDLEEGHFEKAQSQERISEVDRGKGEEAGDREMQLSWQECQHGRESGKDTCAPEEGISSSGSGQHGEQQKGVSVVQAGDCHDYL